MSEQAVTPNDVQWQIGVMPPRVPGAAAGVVLSVGQTQTKVEVLVDPQMADEIAAHLSLAASQARAMSSGLILPGQFPPGPPPPPPGRVVG